MRLLYFNNKYIENDVTVTPPHTNKIPELLSHRKQQCMLFQVLKRVGDSSEAGRWVGYMLLHQRVAQCNLFHSFIGQTLIREAVISLFAFATIEGVLILK